jgi:hypothetical protein
MSRNTARWFPVIATAFALLLGPAIAGPAAAAALNPTGMVRAAPYPPSPPSMALSSSTVCQGCTDTVTVYQFRPLTRVVFFLFSRPHFLGSMTVPDSDTASLTFRIPFSVAPGQHTITASGIAADGHHVKLSNQITVTPAQPTFSAHTGTELLMPMGVGATGLSGGAVALFAARRRANGKSAKS